MPPTPEDKKNSLQSVVDSIQKQVAIDAKSAPAQGYVPNPNLKSLRTFQGDMQEHIEETHESVATIAIAQQKKKIEHNEPTYTERKNSSHSGVFIVLGLILLICGGIISGGIYFFSTQTPKNTQTSITQTLLPYTQKKDIELSAFNISTLASTLIQEKTAFTGNVNSVLYPSFTYQNKKIEDTDLVKLIALRANDALKRNIDNAMIGVLSYSTRELFFIIEPDNFGIAYSGMLNWEAGLGQDMSLFFPELQKHLSTNSSVFIDEVYKNKDVRVIQNNEGKNVLLYGFIDKKTLVITANEEIFEGLLTVYNQSKLVR